MERHGVDVVFRIDPPSSLVCLRLFFRTETWRVIHIVAENLLAILAIPSGIEDVLMPELVHVKRRRRDGNFRALARESKRKRRLRGYREFGFFAIVNGMSRVPIF